MDYDELDASDEAEDESARPSELYHSLAQEAIIALLEREHAAVWPEIEAKLADRPPPGRTKGSTPTTSPLVGLNSSTMARSR